jgi:hypothetical protein
MTLLTDEPNSRAPLGSRVHLETYEMLDTISANLCSK